LLGVQEPVRSEKVSQLSWAWWFETNFHWLFLLDIA